MPGGVEPHWFCNGRTPTRRSGPWIVLTKSRGTTYSLNCNGDCIYIYYNIIHTYFKKDINLDIYLYTHIILGPPRLGRAPMTTPLARKRFRCFWATAQLGTKLPLPSFHGLDTFFHHELASPLGMGDMSRWYISWWIVSANSRRLTMIEYVYTYIHLIWSYVYHCIPVCIYRHTYKQYRSM